jgi:hypothetical protein
MQMIFAPKQDKAQYPSIFLAGTIDQGNSFDWQNDVAQKLENLSITLFNPRRREWDNSWDSAAEDISAQMRRQINWELEHLEGANFICMWIEPDSKSPISLLELGLFAKQKKILIGCPPRYYRAANIYITSKRYGIPLYRSYPGYLRAVRAKARELGAKS